MEEVSLSEVAGMIRLGKSVGKVTAEVMVTEGFPSTVAVVAPPWAAELVMVESLLLEVEAGRLINKVEVGTHSKLYERKSGIRSQRRRVPGTRAGSKIPSFYTHLLEVVVVAGAELLSVSTGAREEEEELADPDDPPDEAEVMVL